MRKLIYGLGLTFFTVFVSSFSYSGVTPQSRVLTADQKINFIENSWKSALSKAKAENKYIFVDAYAVWCAPCRQLKATTFKNKEAAAFFNKNFVNLSLDMEKGEGADLAAKWGVEEFPTLLIIHPTGKIVLGNIGFMEAKELISFGQKGLKKKI